MKICNNNRQNYKVKITRDIFLNKYKYDLLMYKKCYQVSRTSDIKLKFIYLNIQVRVTKKQIQKHQRYWCKSLYNDIIQSSKNLTIYQQYKISINQKQYLIYYLTVSTISLLWQLQNKNSKAKNGTTIFSELQYAHQLRGRFWMDQSWLRISANTLLVGAVSKEPFLFPLRLPNPLSLSSKLLNSAATGLAEFSKSIFSKSASKFAIASPTQV
eukprot:TRINITY_DN405_c0_g3_i1.p1 TRINITY_DN405_c0_g3~~TRINITY_DN405_c0_g3_i1.p1  ORF type:complete len:213 (-),score=-19.25 TRINITY_DN405_c0_g3_i1:42-680(-)